jgi:hypothetical protein
MASFTQKGIGDKVCHLFYRKRVLLMICGWFVPFSLMDIS